MSRPNWMIDNVIAGLQNLVAELEALASGYALDPVVAARVSTAIATDAASSLSVPAPTAPVAGISGGLVALYNAIPVLVSGVTGIDPSVVPALFTLARGVGAAILDTTAKIGSGTLNASIKGNMAPLLLLL